MTTGAQLRHREKQRQFLFDAKAAGILDQVVKLRELPKFNLEDLAKYRQVFGDPALEPDDYIIRSTEAAQKYIRYVAGPDVTLTHV